MATENTHYGCEKIAHMLENCRSVYFIGIGGINMSSLAHLTKERGFRVGGSDRVRTALTERLEREGICVYYGHRAEQVDSYDAVVYTVAVSAENPEYRRACERKIPCISRADYLGYVMADYPRRVGVAGMHGKSSCTSMCAHTAIRAQKDPTVLSGAELAEMGGAYRIGHGEDFIFEACEYMDSFLDLNPTVAVVLNIEMDHVDYFHSMEQIRTSYARYADRVGKDGFVVCNGDDSEVLCALQNTCGTKVTFGTDGENLDFRAVSLSEVRGKYHFDIVKRGEFFCRVELAVPGRHHVYNALACAAACDLCGIGAADIAAGLSSFGGAARRMEYKGKCRGAEVYDDYGHHPTEICATLAGAKKMLPEGGRLFCVYQPHTYSRTAVLLNEFSHAFGEADRVILMDIYAAREQNTFGVSSARLAQKIGRKASYAGTPERAAQQLAEEVSDGDVAVIMGAGDIYQIYDFFNLEKDRAGQ